jgi:type IV pilus assembly protein PilA
MQETLRRMREKRADGDRGFTLIELLVVVVIIGVLVGIAIPVYMNYTKGAANKAAQSDVRNAVTVIEQCYTDNANKYPTALALDTTGKSYDVTGCTNGKVNVSDGVTLTFVAPSGTTYTVEGTHRDGGAKYKYDSATGQTTKS